MANESVIKLFEGKQVRIVWDEEQEKYYFSVADIVQVLTESVNPRDYIKKMLRRDPELKSKWGTICPPVEMEALDGKRRKVQASDLQGIFRIIQSIPSKKAETTSNSCSRIYLRGLQSVTRKTAPSTDELAKRERFASISRAVNTSMHDLSKITTDQAAYVAQRDQAGGKKSLKSYIWSLEKAAYDASHNG